jgi:quercetin dioxygenase-like cupin family protein
MVEVVDMATLREEEMVWGQKVIQKQKDAPRGWFDKLAEEGAPGSLIKNDLKTVRTQHRMKEIRLIHPEAGFEKCGLNMGITTFLPNGSGPLHRHNCYQVMYVLSGRGKLIIEGKEFFAEKGDAISIPPNSRHKSINLGEEPFSYLYVASPPLIAQLDYLEEANKYGYITVLEED